MQLRYFFTLLLFAFIGFTALQAQPCNLLSDNINLGGASHDPGFQEFDDGNGITNLSNGNFVVAWETRSDVDGDGNGAFFQIFDPEGNAITGVMMPYSDVNAGGTGDQGTTGPNVVALNDGFVMSWESEDGPGDTGPMGDDQQDAFFRVYNNDGSPITGSTRLSVADQEDFIDFILPISSTGGFVLLTRIDEDTPQQTNDDEFFVQVYNAAGVATSGAPINISGGLHDAAFQTINRGQPMIDLGNGSFAVTWEARDAADGDGNGGFFRIFNIDGTPVTGVITPYADINPSGTGDQGTPGPRLTRLLNGNFVVAWDSERGPGDIGPGGNDDVDVYFRVYSSNGTPVTGSTKANSDNVIEEEILIGLITLTGGNFAILYRTDEDDTGNNDDIFLRTFLPDGTAAGSSTEVSGGLHQNVTCFVRSQLEQANGSFRALNNGNVVVGWVARDDADGDEAGIYYRVFNASGLPVSPVTLPYQDINPMGTGDQSPFGPYVITLPDGFAIVWDSELGPGDVGLGGDQNKDVYHRVIDNTGTPLCGTIKTCSGNDAEEELVVIAHALANGNFAVIYKDDEDDTGGDDDFFLRIIGGAPEVAVCPTVGTLTSSASSICVGETVNLTASGLENMAEADNGDQDYGVTFVSFALGAGNPYAGGTVLGTVAFADLGDDATTATLNGVAINESDPDLFIYAILSTAPEDEDCRPSVQTVVAINEFPNASFTAPADLCIDAGVQSGLGGGSPVGGVYSGSGLTDDGNGMTYSFDPAAAGVGTHPITYTVTVNGCSDAATDDIVVNPLPSVTLTAFGSLCVDDGVQTNLSGGSPAGGVYSGPGVTDDGNGTTYSFDPSAAGVGVHPITYTVTENACSGTVTENITVNAAPNPTLILPLEFISVNAPALVDQTGGSPAGGVYSGPGVTDDGNGMTFSFDPAVAGVGIHPIVYTLMAENGCSASTSNDIEVIQIPLSAIGDIDDVDADGIAIQEGELVAVQGIVHCSDFDEGVGIEFWIIEPTGDGISVFSSSTFANFPVMEGDELLVEGTLSTFNGLLDILPIAIVVQSQGNPLNTPLEVPALGEDNQSKWVALTGTIAAGEMPVAEGSDYRFSVTTGDMSTESVVVKGATGIGLTFLEEFLVIGSDPDSDGVKITGIVTQNDDTLPLTEGYELWPCNEDNFEIIVGVDEPAWASALRLFPNPTKDQLIVNAPITLQAYRLMDVQGRQLQSGPINDVQHRLGLESLPQGVYQLQLISNGELVTRRVVKQ